MTPSETSVSIDEAPCRALTNAARCSGHADQTTTGAASATTTHSQPGKRAAGSTESASGRSTIGMKSTAATTRRRHRSATRSSRAGVEAASSPLPSGARSGVAP